jgi:hypothetical protein
MNATILCNRALAHLGEERITDFHETSVIAEKCRTHYDFELKTLLRMHRWNFARARANLSELADAPLFGWDHQYQLPNDCLRVLELNGVEVQSTDDAFEIEGRKLLTDADSASILYTRLVEDPTEFDVLFCDAFSYTLAVALCKEITNSTSEKDALMQFFKDAMKEAGWTDAVETRPRVIPPARNSPTLAARRGAVTG